jgi:hypothetical protein
MTEDDGITGHVLGQGQQCVRVDQVFVITMTTMCKSWSGLCNHMDTNV